jgi:hypothetical protein
LRRPVEEEGVGAAEAVAQEAGEAAERDRIIADHEEGPAAADADAVADVRAENYRLFHGDEDGPPCTAMNK